jgi:Ca-activated chloride channel family protein
MINYWRHITFAEPRLFFLVIIPLLLVGYYLWRQRQRFPELTLSNLGGMTQLSSKRGALKGLTLTLRVIVLCLLIMAMARPRSSLKEQNITSEGIDIVMAMDISSSMLAKDFEPNRMEAAKRLSKDFIEARPNDRIGLVVFAGESFTQCPVTTDHEVLLKLLSELKDGMVEDGTAIGMGLATSVTRLQESQTKSKVVILLTDGVNNSGMVDPTTAAEAAIQFGVRVYTIGVGTRGEAPYPFQMGNQIVYQNVPVQIDEELLGKIAKMTGGQYYRATNNASLKKIYEEIDTLEKSKIKVASIERTSDEFFPFVLAAIILLFSELILRYTYLRSLP